MKTKFLTKSLLAGLLAGTMFAATAAKAQEVTFWTLNFDAEVRNQAMDDIAESFEAKNPGVDIVIVRRATDEHKTALRVAAGSDSGPDIYFNWAGLGLGGVYVKTGLSKDLTEYYDQYGWMDKILPSATAFASLYAEGKHGVASAIKGEAIYYRKSLFEKAGIVGEPSTYEELLEAAEKLKAINVAPITFGGTVNWHVMRLMDVLLEKECGAETHDALTSMSVSWTETPCATAAFEQMDKWSRDYILKPFMGIDHKQAFGLFQANRAGMMLEGNWLVNGVDQAGIIDDIGIFPFPTGTGRLYGFGENNYISSKSKNPDIAAAFLDHLASKEVQQAALGKLSTDSVTAGIVYENQRDLEVEWKGIFAEYGEMFLNGDQAFPGDVTPEYFRVINELASQNMTPAEAVTAMQTFIDNRS